MCVFVVSPRVLGFRCVGFCGARHGRRGGVMLYRIRGVFCRGLCSRYVFCRGHSAHACMVHGWLMERSWHWPTSPPPRCSFPAKGSSRSSLVAVRCLRSHCTGARQLPPPPPRPQLLSVTGRVLPVVATDSIVEYIASTDFCSLVAGHKQ